MKSQIKTFCLIVAALAMTIIVIEGCTMAKISGKGTIPLMLNQPQAKVEVIQQIKESKMIVFDYTSSFDASEILSEVFTETDADAIINLVFTVKTTPADFFINLFTLGIANAKTMEMSGQAIKAPEGLGSLSIPGSETLAESENVDDLLPAFFQKSHLDGSSTMIIRDQQREDGLSYKLVRY